MMKHFFTILLIFGVALCGWAGSLSAAWADAPDYEYLGDLRQKAFSATNVGDFAAAETYWTQILEELPESAAVYSNRGNSRVSQNKLELAIADYNRAIDLMPEAPDPYLNRGAAWEGLQQWEKAIADYNHVLELTPNDPAAYNNRGNANSGREHWEQALADYQKAAELAPDFAIARANLAIVRYEIGQTDDAIREMRNLVRKYPRFADMRAALTAALWEAGQRGEAESNWFAAIGLDSRYRNIDWVRHVRRWPPAITQALEKFLTLQS